MRSIEDQLTILAVGIARLVLNVHLEAYPDRTMGQIVTLLEVMVCSCMSGCTNEIEDCLARTVFITVTKLDSCSCQMHYFDIKMCFTCWRNSLLPGIQWLDS